MSKTFHLLPMVPIKAGMALVLLDLESGRTLLDLIEKGLQNEVKNLFS